MRPLDRETTATKPRGVGSDEDSSASTQARMMVADDVVGDPPELRQRGAAVAVVEPVPPRRVAAVVWVTAVVGIVDINHR